jgi:hypothetical protein
VSEKKIIGRNVAIALGIMCIILAVGLIGVVANYTSIISGKDNAITSKEGTISSLNSQVANLTDIANLDKSKVWVNHHEISHEAGYETYWTFSAIYAGYVSVDINEDNTTTTYVRAIYSAYGVKYDNQMDVVAGGTAVFPILPSSGIEIRIGNTNLLIGANETVTITYHY